MKTKLVLVPLLILVMLAGCATSAGFKKAAAVSKMSAEAAYGEIYAGYLHGRVSLEAKDNAASVYDQYVVVQWKIATALTNDDYDEATKQLTAARILTDLLVDLAFELGVISLD